VPFLARPIAVEFVRDYVFVTARPLVVTDNVPAVVSSEIVVVHRDYRSYDGSVSGARLSGVFADSLNSFDRERARGTGRRVLTTYAISE